MTTTVPVPGSQPPNFAVPIANSKPLQPKKHPITNDYTILTRCLGVGVNGKVLECIHKATGEKKALKVSDHKAHKYCVYGEGWGLVGFNWNSLPPRPHWPQIHTLFQCKINKPKLDGIVFFVQIFFFLND